MPEHDTTVVGVAIDRALETGHELHHEELGVVVADDALDVLEA